MIKHILSTSRHPAAALAAVTILSVWTLTAPFTDGWQLLINMATTLVALSVIFLIHRSEHREAEVLRMRVEALLKDEAGPQPLKAG